MRTGRQLIDATVPFTEHSARISWWHVGSTFALLATALAAAGFMPWWPLQLLFSLLAAMLVVRAFITYHDYAHRAILARSRIAWLLFRLYAAFTLAPLRSWRKSHNHHHGHVGRICLLGTGTFPIMTAKMWREASWGTKAGYRLARHPVTILAGYMTIFFFSITLLPLLKYPARHWDSLLALAGHAALIAALWVLGGFSTAFFAMLLPLFVASALGSYLFFAQHNFDQMRIPSAANWTYSGAALESSSYLRLGGVMRWFTGNIGFHHVHHLNVRIPFYRLPEVMDAIPELQSPATTTLRIHDICSCFKCCLWDEDRQRAISYREASKSVNALARGS